MRAITNLCLIDSKYVILIVTIIIKMIIFSKKGGGEFFALMKTGIPDGEFLLEQIGRASCRERVSSPV